MKKACAPKAAVEHFNQHGGFLWQDRKGRWHNASGPNPKEPPSTAKRVAHYKEMHRQYIRKHWLGPTWEKKRAKFNAWNVVKVHACKR